VKGRESTGQAGIARFLGGNGRRGCCQKEKKKQAGSDRISPHVEAAGEEQPTRAVKGKKNRHWRVAGVQKSRKMGKKNARREEAKERESRMEQKALGVGCHDFGQ